MNKNKFSMKKLIKRVVGSQRQHIKASKKEIPNAEMHILHRFSFGTRLLVLFLSIINIINRYDRLYKLYAGKEYVN